MAPPTLKPNAKIVPFGIPLEVCFKVHEDNVVILRGMVEKDLQKCGDIGTQKDDLFLLRFLLSARGNVEVAAKNVRTCIAYRKEYLEDIKYVVNHGKQKDSDKIERLLTVKWLDDGMGDLKYPVFIFRLGSCYTHAYGNTIPYERIVRQQLMTKEEGFQRCDHLTRKTGKLVKQMCILDFTGFKLSAANRRVTDAQTEANKIGGQVYPQALGKLVCINLNLAFRVLWKIFKPITPRSILDKQTVCPFPGTNKPNADINLCPFVRSLKAAGQLPTFLGGKLKTPPELIEACHRGTGVEQHKLPPSLTTRIVSHEIAAEVSEISVELLYLSSGTVTLKASLNDLVLGEPSPLTLKDGLVRRTFECPEPGIICIDVVNKSRFTRLIEVTVLQCNSETKHAK